MTDYLSTYGKRTRTFQEGGPMPAEGGAPAGPEGAPQGGGGEEEQVLALAQAAMEGDMEAAAQLGMMLAPMILEQAGGGAPQGGGEPMPAEGGAPTFRKGGRLA